MIGMHATGPNQDHAPLWVTTSWDDGYPLDLRLAEALDRFGIRGTFYVPVRSHLPVMNAGQIRELARSFDIGAHTVNHVRLDMVPWDCGREEIIGSKHWIEDVTGAPCAMFCPPGGRYRRSHLADFRRAGYHGIRTVELLSVGNPEFDHGLALLPTTLQLYPHRASTYLKNALKRARPGNVKTGVRHVYWSELPEAAESIIERLLATGGVFHLWGHSWELEHSRLWGVLDRVLRILHSVRDRCRFVSNAALCRYLRPAGEPDRLVMAGSRAEELVTTAAGLDRPK